MDLSPKYKKIIKTVQTYQKANPESTLKASLTACKVAPHTWAHLRSKGAVPLTRAPRGSSKQSTYQKIETAPPPSSDSKLVMLMGTPSQIKDFMGQLL